MNIYDMKEDLIKCISAGGRSLGYTHKEDLDTGSLYAGTMEAIDVVLRFDFEKYLKEEE